MNNLKNKKWILILSLFMILLIMGAATAAEDKNSNINETITSQNNDDVKTVDTLSTSGSVDNQVSAADNNQDIVGSDDTNDNFNILNSANNKTENKLSAAEDSLVDGDELDQKIKSTENNGKLILTQGYNITKNLDIYKSNILIDGGNQKWQFNNKQLNVYGNNVTLTHIQFTNMFFSSSFGLNNQILNCNMTDFQITSARALIKGFDKADGIEVTNINVTAPKNNEVSFFQELNQISNINFNNLVFPERDSYVNLAYNVKNI